MKKIKIKFDGFIDVTTNQLNREAQFVLSILKKKYDVEISESPEYIFYDVNGKEYYNYDCVRIFLTIEALCPDFNLCDYGIGFEYLNYGDRYFRFPNFYFYENLADKVKHKHENISRDFANRAFCSFVYSNNRADEMRTRLFNGLSEYQKVDSGGRFMNNLPDGKAVENKSLFEKEHKFSIACENASHPGYHTEKLAEAFAAQTVPVYWGDPEVEKVFNPKAFINCNAFSSIEEIVDRVQYLDSHPDEYIEVLKQPAFLNETTDAIEEFVQYLYHIFDQPFEEAFRRNRGFWGKQYLQEKRNIYNIIKKYEKLKSLWPIRLVVEKKRKSRLYE